MAKRTSVQSPALSKNEHLLRWVDKIHDLVKPSSVHWVDGSQEENEASVGRWSSPALSSSSTKNSGQTATTRVPIQATWRAWRIALSFARFRKTAPAPRTIGKILSKCAGSSRVFSTARCRAHDVRAAVQHGACRLSAFTHRSAAHRFALRCREHAHHGQDRPARISGNR